MCIFLLLFAWNNDNADIVFMMILMWGGTILVGRWRQVMCIFILLLQRRRWRIKRIIGAPYARPLPALPLHILHSAQSTMCLICAY